ADDAKAAADELVELGRISRAGRRLPLLTPKLGEVGVPPFVSWLGDAVGLRVRVGDHDMTGHAEKRGVLWRATSLAPFFAVAIRHDAHLAGRAVADHVDPVERRVARVVGVSHPEPERRMRLLERCKLDWHVVEVKMLSVVGKALLRKRLHD